MERIKAFLKSRKRYLIYTLISFIFFTTLFYLLSLKVSVAFTIKGQHCFPYKVWLVKKGESYSKGDYVAFKNFNIGGKVTWIKKVSGMSGDFIRVEKVPENNREAFKIFIDEIGKELRVQGLVYISFGPATSPEVFVAFETDSKGKPLPLIGEGRIPVGKFFVSSEAVRSYDSRYWGLINEGDIIGRAYPIL